MVIHANSDNEAPDSFRGLERLLGRLDDCTVMRDVEMEFVEDIVRRVIAAGEAVKVTRAERKELARLKRRYLQ